MTIYDALRKLEIDQAAKLPSWGGYIYKDDPDTGSTGHKLVFKHRDGTEKTYAVSSTGTITTSAAETLDVELLGAIMSNTWEIDDAATYETARSGSGTW